MIVTTTNTLGDQDIVETLGMVRGATTWRRRIMKSYAGGIRSVQQSGTLDFDEALGEIKQQAMAELEKAAKAAGATAVVGLVEQVTEITSGVFSVTLMGTAVRCQPKAKQVAEHKGDNDNAEALFHLYENQYAAQGAAYCH